ncbi:cell division protein ZapD [Comamonas nitrativorans]|uniref:Cell division protein ZapD n=1 Tax=Comamonas nitrativorans TaxID=108437 RepID=A0ABV9GWT1_9BURK|nr:cell division protein ZapD [Comamonas sp.]
MILYEYPFNERVRTYLRLEQLFRRLLELMTREAAIDHHFALVTMFEILEVASRADLKSDVMRDLERQKNLLDGLRDNPDIAQDMLEKIIGQLNQRYASLHAQSGKTGQILLEGELLNALRSRLEIPGGTNGFDLPAYFHWQHLPTEQRQEDLRRWGQCLKPLADAVFLLLGLLRDTGTPQKVAATHGHFQQALPSAKAYQLLRLRIDPALHLVPEISGNRLIVSVRLQHAELQGDHYSLVPSTDNAHFELTLCA